MVKGSSQFTVALVVSSLVLLAGGGTGNIGRASTPVQAGPAQAASSWVAAKSGTHASLEGVAFAGSQNAWAVGDAILDSIDGGATWSSAVDGKLPETLEGATFSD